MTPSFIIIPVLDNPEMSKRAIISAASQLGVDPLTVLVVDQGSAPVTREMIDNLHQIIPTLRVWRHSPPLPALAATWNRALDYAWESGGKDALMINNDVELSLTYYQQLRARMQQDTIHFLSGVGVNPGQAVGLPAGQELTEPFQLHPDFSAFVITRLCHKKYRFDEGFVPAYCEDVDYHRRMLLGDDGRRIGKINIPFLHHGSGSLKAMDPEQNRRWSDRIRLGSRAYYEQKWGPVNEEMKAIAFGTNDYLGVTTGELRQVAEKGESVDAYVLLQMGGQDYGKAGLAEPPPGPGEPPVEGPPLGG